MLFYATFRLYNLLVLFKKKQYANNGRLIALRLQNQPYPERNVWWCGRSENMKIGGKCLL